MIRAALFLILAVICPADVTLAQQNAETYQDDPTMPAGLLGERIRSLIETINSADPGEVRRFMEDECTESLREFAPMETHVETFRFLRRFTGGVDFHSIRTYSPPRERETVVVVRDRNYEAWRSFRLFIDDRDTYRLSGFLLDHHPGTPSDVGEAALSESEAIAAARAVVDRVCRNDVFSGAVLLAAADQILLSHACGEASKRYRVPNKVDTKFYLASINKMITGTAIAQLVERGALSYEDTLSRYVDDSWLPREISDRITIHHLLTHTSGLGDIGDEPGRTSSLRYRNLDDFKPLIWRDTLAFEPGEGYRYSNNGMFLLGIVIEKVTGRSYYDYIRENIFDPAGMQDSGYYELDQPVDNLATGYVDDSSGEYGWRENTFEIRVKGTPASGGYSTVVDLHRFARALLKGALVPNSALPVMWTRYGEGDGYGFQVHQRAIGKAVGHTGGSLGASGQLTIYADAGYLIAALSNYGSTAQLLVTRIEQLVERIR
ncbi:MAG: serine hydrolase [Gemmatimonadota bacterium]|nr:MAG: serine hydrolase [Gemmatimonadota bacterium]